MAVEHRDDTQPIASKLRSREDGDNGEVSENGKPHNGTDNKENLHENGNNNTNDNHNDNHNGNHDDNNGHKASDNNKNETKVETDAPTDTPQINQDDTNTDQHDDDTNDENSNAEQVALEEGVTALGIAEPSNFTVKHPLQNGWTIWYDNPGKRSNQASWGDNLKKITTFGTVEDFWRVFNNLKPASALAQGSNYHIFKEQIEPKWEDAQNSKGGKWTLSIPPKSRASSLDQMWLWTVLACIGETFKSPDDVCGLVVSVRKAGDRVQIWTKDATNEQACRDIGRSLKEALELSDSTVIGYQSHADSMKKAARNRYEV